MSTDIRFSPASYPSLRRDGSAKAYESADRRCEAAGYAAGYAAGLRAAAGDSRELRARLVAEQTEALERNRKEVDRTVEVLAAAAASLNERTLPVIAESGDILAAAALDLAEAILGHELRDEEGSARAALVRATAQVDRAVKPLVRMNPDDLAVLGSEILGRTDMTFIPDPGLARGDAISEFPDGFLDARIGTALERAKAALLGGL